MSWWPKKTRFFPVSPMAFCPLYYYGSLPRKPIGDSGRRFLKNPVPEIISKLVFCPSPQSGLFFFVGASRTFYYHGSPPRGGHFMAKPTAYVGQPTRRLRVVLGAYSHCPLFPLPLCSHFYSSSQHETTHFLSFVFLVEFCPRNI